uniref:glucuronosyltransferase n=1 Tax=Elaeophora elaphi TaxID=1147741 RepID=A0A0R3S165_9BILA
MVKFIALFLILLSFLNLNETANILVMPNSLFLVRPFTMRALAKELIKRKHSVIWVEYGFYRNVLLIHKQEFDASVTKNFTAVIVDDLYNPYGLLLVGMLPNAFYMERNATINFVNTPQIFDFARPYMPRVVFIGAIQRRKAALLKKKWLTFIDKADVKNGFVLFTTGFAEKWNLAPKYLIVGHPEVRAHITHGDLNGVSENV